MSPMGVQQGGQGGQSSQGSGGSQGGQGSHDDGSCNLQGDADDLIKQLGEAAFLDNFFTDLASGIVNATGCGDIEIKVKIFFFTN